MAAGVASAACVCTSGGTSLPSPWPRAGLSDWPQLASPPAWKKKWRRRHKLIRVSIYDTTNYQMFIIITSQTLFLTVLLHQLIYSFSFALCAFCNINASFTLGI